MKGFVRVVIILALIGAAYYGYKQYRLRMISPPIVEVEYGEVIQCVSCGKVISRNTQITRVRKDQQDNYPLIRKDAVCDACRAHGLQR